MHKIESQKIIEMTTKPPFLTIHYRRKANAVAREVAAAFGAMLLVLLVGCSAPKYATVEPETPTKRISALPPLPQQSIAARSSVLPAKTNGVVTLTWKAGDPDKETVIVNQSTGVAYPATSAETLTVGGLAIGSTQTFIATNSAGASLPASAVVVPDLMTLKFQTWLYLTWPGPAGTLQRTSDLVIWQDVQPISRGGSYIVTNTGVKAFYRVKF